MEIRGEEFIRKVRLQQEKNEMGNEQSIPKEELVLSPNLEKEIKKQEEAEYSDIMLNTSSSNESDKKKFILYGFILLIIFLLTILFIRFLSDDSSSDNSFSKNEQDTEKELLENDNIEDQYQKIINEKLKSIKEENEKSSQKDEEIDKKLNLEEIEEKETLVKESKPSKPDVFHMKDKSSDKKTTKKKIVKKVEKKEKEIKKKVKAPKKSKKIVTTKPKGTFVQIGAFSKVPNDKYLTTITKKGFKYKVYKVSIKSKTFYKVLIGPYNSRGQAELARNNIKKKLNISGAFILTF